MWGDPPLPEIPDSTCVHCREKIFYSWGRGWTHEQSKSIRCELHAEPVHKIEIPEVDL